VICLHFSGVVAAKNLFRAVGKLSNKADAGARLTEIVVRAVVLVSRSGAEAEASWACEVVRPIFDGIRTANLLLFLHLVGLGTGLWVLSQRGSAPYSWYFGILGGNHCQSVDSAHFQNPFADFMTLHRLN
jgi:hypothetical protein